MIGMTTQDNNEETIAVPAAAKGGDSHVLAAAPLKAESGNNESATAAVEHAAPIEQKEVAQEEVAQEQVAQEQVAQEQVAQEEAVQDEATQEAMQEDGMQSDGAQSDGVQKETTGPSRALSALAREQLRYCATVLKGLKRHPQAGPFLLPVDPVALNIPEYVTIVKSPMDLSTVTAKLDAGQYESADAFAADIRLMLSNCFLFNQPDTQVCKMGHALEKYFTTTIAKMPTAITAAATSPAGLHRAGSSSMQSSSSASSIASLGVGGIARIKRQSKVPRRLANTQGKGTGTPPTKARLSGNAEMAFCAGILRELTKKTNQSFMWPFLEPVDAVKLGIPDYFTVIKSPMDISTVKAKLEAGKYATAEDFEADVRLVIANCYTYNAPDSDVVNLCKAFVSLFEAKWAEKPDRFAPPSQGAIGQMGSPSSRGASRAAAGGAAGGSYAAPQAGGSFSRSSSMDDGDSDSEKILEINRQIQALQHQLNTLLMKRRSRSISGASSSQQGMPRPSKKSGTTKGGHAAAGLGGPQRKASSSSSAASKERGAGAPQGGISETEFMSLPMSFEEKRQLSIDVNNLSPERLGRVVEIIQAGMSLEAQGDSDIIELDIESLNIVTLRQLQRYVYECKGITSLAFILREGAHGTKRAKKEATAAQASKMASSAAVVSSSQRGGSSGTGREDRQAIPQPSSAVPMSSDESSSSSSVDEDEYDLE